MLVAAMLSRDFRFYLSLNIYGLMVDSFGRFQCGIAVTLPSHVLAQHTPQSLYNMVCLYNTVLENPGRFGVGCYGRFLGWVVSALVGGSFRSIFEDESFRPWVVSAKVYRNYLGNKITHRQDNSPTRFLRQFTDIF